MEIPNEWRDGCITLFKKGNRTSTSNYRPVSLTCILCKVKEQFIRDHTVDHMKNNMFFSQKQFGFISGRSTMLQLIHVLEKWTEILDNGGSLDCVFRFHEGVWQSATLSPIKIVTLSQVS